MRGVSDALCRENDLSTIAPQGKGKHYAEWKAENTGKPTIRSIIRGDIDSIIGVLQTKVNRKNEKSPAKFTRPKMGITKQAGEKSHRQPG